MWRSLGSRDFWANVSATTQAPRDRLRRSRSCSAPPSASRWAAAVLGRVLPRLRDAHADHARPGLRARLRDDLRPQLDLGPIVAIVLTSFPHVTVNVVEGVRAIPRDLTDMARRTACPADAAPDIILPAFAPFLFTAVALRLRDRLEDHHADRALRRDRRHRHPDPQSSSSSSTWPASSPGRSSSSASRWSSNGCVLQRLRRSFFRGARRRSREGMAMQTTARSTAPAGAAPSTRSWSQRTLVALRRRGTPLTSPVAVPAGLAAARARCCRSRSVADARRGRRGDVGELPTAPLVAAFSVSLLRLADRVCDSRSLLGGIVGLAMGLSPRIEAMLHDFVVVGLTFPS